MADTRQCPHCGRVLEADARFCSGCGTPLGNAAPPPGPTRASLQEVFAHLRSGEQRPVTVLMTDLTGFTSLGEQVEPEWLFHLLNRVFEELAGCLLAHGAHLDKFVGDEIVAVFGVPLAQEGSAERALLAALAIHERLQALNEERRFGDTVLQIHTGINQGRVMVGPVGYGARSDYTVIGDAVNVAARLEQEAPAGEIYVSGTVVESVGAAFEFASVGSTNLAGRESPVEVFRLVSARHLPALRPAAGTTAAGGEARGRSLRSLCRLRTHAPSDECRAVCVYGSAGSGKSWLISRFARDEGSRGSLVLSTACPAFGEHFPLLPLADLAAQVLGLSLRDWPPRVAGDVERALSALDLSSSHAALVRSLLEQVHSPSHALDASSLVLLPDALLAVLEQAARARPVLLLFEDLQWVDEVSRGVLEAVLARRTATPTLLVFSAREPCPAWLAPLGVSRIHLRPLPRPILERLVIAWASPSLLSGAALQAICDRAEGHPYFAHELTRAYLERRPARAGSTVPELPTSLEELFLAQMDQLAPPQRHLVQTAAVLGEPLAPQLLTELMGTDDLPATELLAEATRQGLLRLGPRPGQFLFGPRLLFEAAYSTVPPSQRRELHARIAAHMLEHLDAMGSGAIHAAAHHAYLGFRDGRAVDLLLQSARLYHTQYASRQAAGDADRAVQLLRAQSDEDHRLDQHLAALLQLATSDQLLGDLDAAEAALTEARHLADAGAPPDAQAQIATSSAVLCWMRGDPDEADARFAQACDLWTSLGETTRAAQALVGRGMCAGQRGDDEHALEYFRQAAASPGVDDWVRAAAYNNAGMILLEHGQYSEAEPLLRQGLAASESQADRRGMAHSQASLGELCYRLGRFGEAEEWLQQAHDLAEEIEDVPCAALALLYLARARLMGGDQPSARRLLAEHSAPDPELAQLTDLLGLTFEECGLVAPVAVEPDRVLAPPPSASCDTSCRNVSVELHCLRLERALASGDRETLATSARDLSAALPQACDQHLRSYGTWLLLLAQSDATPPAPPFAASVPPTVFTLRAASLLTSRPRP